MPEQIEEVVKRGRWSYDETVPAEVYVIATSCKNTRLRHSDLLTGAARTRGREKERPLTYAWRISATYSRQSHSRAKRLARSVHGA